MLRFAMSAVLAGLWAFLLPPAAAAAPQAPSEPVQNSLAELKALQKERIETLAKIAKLLKLQYNAGQVDFRRLVAAEMKLIDAKVESADTLSEGIALLEELLAMAKKVLDLTEARYQRGFRVSEIDLLESKTLYLDVKIRLLRERAKVKAQAK